MDRRLIRIQKGYLLIDKAKTKIKMLSESKKLMAEKQKLQDMKAMEDKINETTNALKNMILENEEALQRRENELKMVLKNLYTNQKKESRTIKENKKRETEIKQERNLLKKEIMKLFVKVDALKEEMNEYKKSYNEMEKRFLKQLSYQNSIIVQYEDKITMMEKKIRRIRKSIDSDILSVYDKKRQKNIVVMSKVVDGKCENCGYEINEDLVEQIFKEEMTECPKCEKILYIEEEIRKEEA